MPTPILAFVDNSLVTLVVVLIAVAASIPLWILPAILAYTALNKIPQEHQKQKPSMAFLLLIPIFNIIWNFFVHQKVAESIESYANASNQPKGKCGWGLALSYSICICCTIIPVLGILCALGAIVVISIFYIQAFSTIRQIKPVS